MAVLHQPARHPLILSLVYRPLRVEAASIAAAEEAAEATGHRTEAEEGHLSTIVATGTHAVALRKGAGDGNETIANGETGIQRQIRDGIPAMTAIEETGNCSAPKWRLAPLLHKSRLRRPGISRRLPLPRPPQPLAPFQTVM